MTNLYIQVSTIVITVIWDPRVVCVHAFPWQIVIPYISHDERHVGGSHVGWPHCTCGPLVLWCYDNRKRLRVTFTLSQWTFLFLTVVAKFSVIWFKTVSFQSVHIYIMSPNDFNWHSQEVLWCCIDKDTVGK